MTETELLLSIVKDIQSHILIINTEMGGTQVDVAVLKNQMSELMWMSRLVLGSTVGIIIERIYFHFKQRK